MAGAQERVSVYVHEEKRDRQRKSMQGHQREGAWGAQSVKRLPSAQVMILGSWDQAPSLLFLLPLTLPPLMHMHARSLALK